MTLRDQPQLPLSLRQRDVEGRFAAAHSFQQKFQGQGCLARTGLAFEQVHPLGVDTATENVVQAGIPGGNPRKLIYV